MSGTPPELPRVYLLDIEGTTTPLSFVHEVLFPYARHHLEAFLRAHAAEPEVERDVEGLLTEREAESAAGAGATDADATAETRTAASSPGADRVAEAAAHALWLMERDRKSPALKSLQGKIWREGYARGALHGDVFADVPTALHRWRARGARTGIFSSGSVLAQELLLGHSTAGDLRLLVSRHFDLAVGGKRETASYVRIAAALAEAPSAVLFVSDIVPELDAARAAGMATRLALRPGNAAVPPSTHEPIGSFDQLP